MAELKTLNTYLFEIIIKNIKLFIIVGITAIVAATLFSSPTFISPKYKSTAIVYPSNLVKYSKESPIEQMMQWFESVDIKDKVIADNNLIEHYKIDKEDKLYYYYLLNEYDDNISVSETKYESAEITVKDEDPKVAYKIVNSVIDNFNKVVRKIKLKREVEDFKKLEYRYHRVLAQLDSIGVEVQLLDNPKAKITSGIKNYLRLKEDITKSSNNYILNNDKLTTLLEEYAKINQDYNYTLAIMNNKRTYTNLVVKPYINYKKVYPIRWLIVVSSLFGALFFTFITLLFIKKIKN